MQHYYLNLVDHPDLITREKVADGIRLAANRAFEPFDIYLNNAIKTLEKKSDIKAKWKPVNQDQTLCAELKLQGNIYCIPSKKGRYRIECDISDDELDFDENIIAKAATGTYKAKITAKDWVKKEVFFEDCTENTFDKVTWNGEKITLIPLWKNTTFTGEILSQESDEIFVYCQTGNPQNTDAKVHHKITSFIDRDNLRDENGKPFSYEEREDDNLKIILKNEEDFGKIISSGKLRFEIKEPTQRKDDRYWIQLLEETDDDGKEELVGSSPLSAFFGDDIEIVVENRQQKGKKNPKDTYQVLRGKESELQVILCQGKGKDRKPCFPPKDAILQVRANAYQLKKQRDAIYSLKTMPVGSQASLIRLFEDRDKARWEKPSTNQVENWQVLTDEQRLGNNIQRDFVEKALNTPDFAILEGPPGSGKTTVILELICQLAQQGKRVLLCGSTHIAIDNVLERLDEQRQGKSLLEQFDILPVRIGDTKRISDSVEHFQLDEQVKNYSIDENLLLKMSNLVCGTTVGILQHPTLKAQSKDRAMPILPDFDYLIIDESSKTTFQEFLIPALWAKKWVLVGDVMQLAPFTDREEIVSNIQKLPLIDENISIGQVRKSTPKTLDIHLQMACFYIDKIKRCFRGKYNRFILPLPEKAVEFFEKEVNARRDTDNQLNKLLIKYIKNKQQVSSFELSAYDLIIINENKLSDYLENNLLPHTHILLRSKDWQGTKHAFEHNSYQERNYFKYSERGNNEFITNSFKIVNSLNDYFSEKNWAEEITWRIEREHQLRLVTKTNKIDSYKKAVEELTPYSQDREKTLNAINSIAAMAFPSILESLVKGIKGRKTKVKSTISEGFREELLEERRSILKYQQRMHPDISQFPRDQFYKQDGALQDGKIEREWSYPAYPSRSIWLDVKGKTQRNRNQDEVKKIRQELEKFMQYANNNPLENGKKWSVAVLSFYRGQESLLREMLQNLTGKHSAFSQFRKGNVEIKLHTVDKFQGQEADIVFLSMVQTYRDGFMDNPNRLNVAITRAKYQLIIVGDYDYFSQRSRSEDLKALAHHHKTNKDRQ